MVKSRLTDFCTGCRKEVEYRLKGRKLVKTIGGKKYVFRITAVVCSECGEEMGIPGLIDRNIREVEGQYRALEDLKGKRAPT